MISIGIQIYFLDIILVLRKIVFNEYIFLMPCRAQTQTYTRGDTHTNRGLFSGSFICPARFLSKFWFQSSIIRVKVCRRDLWIYSIHADHAGIQINFWPHFQSFFHKQVFKNGRSPKLLSCRKIEAFFEQSGLILAKREFWGWTLSNSLYIQSIAGGRSTAFSLIDKTQNFLEMVIRMEIKILNGHHRSPYKRLIWKETWNWQFTISISI